MFTRTWFTDEVAPKMYTGTTSLRFGHRSREHLGSIPQVKRDLHVGRLLSFEPHPLENTCLCHF